MTVSKDRQANQLLRHRINKLTHMWKGLVVDQQAHKTLIIDKVRTNGTYIDKQ